MASTKKPVNRRAMTSAYLLLTENCNLRCTYCFEKDTRCVTKYMSKETAFKTIDFLFQQAIDNDVDEIKVTFFGGEPMLCPELMTDIIHYSEAKSKENGKNVAYNIITNGTLYNEKIETFLDVWREYKGKVDIQLSIDGLPEIQDKNRPCASGESSSKLVEIAVPKYKEYLKKHNLSKESLHIHACVSKESLPRIFDSFRYFVHDLDIINSKFAWVIEDNWDDKDLDIFSAQMHRIVKWLSEITTNEKRFPFKYFDHSSGCSAGQNLVAIDTDGNIYACHRFFFYNRDKRNEVVLGNLDEGITHPERREQFFGIDYSEISPEICQICIATNYSCAGDIHQLPNKYGSKFMALINQYYDFYCELLEKKANVTALTEMAELVKQLLEQVQSQEERIKKLEEITQTIKEV